MCQISKDLNLTAGFRLGHVFGSDPACNQARALASTSRLLKDYDLAAIIGPACSPVCEVIALLVSRLFCFFHHWIFGNLGPGPYLLLRDTDERTKFTVDFFLG